MKRQIRPQLTLPKPPKRPTQSKPAVRSVPQAPVRLKPAKLFVPKLQIRSPRPKPTERQAFKPAGGVKGIISSRQPDKNKIKSTRVLSISSNQALLETRRLILEEEGFQVISATDFRQVMAACEEGKFGLAIIGHSLTAKIKRAIAGVVRDRCPKAPLLELCLVSPEIPDAEYHLIGAEPRDLVQKLRSIRKSLRSG